MSNPQLTLNDIDNNPQTVIIGSHLDIISVIIVVLVLLKYSISSLLNFSYAFDIPV